MRSRPCAVLALAALTVLAAPLSAKVIKYVSNAGNFSFTDDSVFLELNDSGSTEISFQGGSGQKLVAITFSAECSAAGDPDGWVNIDILVDGEAVEPTQIDEDAFCSGNGAAEAGEGGWVTASRTVAKKLGPGQHKVRVRATLEDTTQGWIGDSSLTIIN